jgi:tagatose-1,6-bisphosphate aldolase
LAVFALDHRNNLRNALRSDAPDAVTPAEMAAFKQEVIAALAPVTSAVLLDPEVGAAQCIAAGVLPGPTGLVLALDATGYTGDPTARQSQILPGWSVAKAKRVGADAVKLLVYYHLMPLLPPRLRHVRQAAADCLAQDIPCFSNPSPTRPIRPTRSCLRRAPPGGRRNSPPPGGEGRRRAQAEFPLDGRRTG